MVAFYEDQPEREKIIPKPGKCDKCGKKAHVEIHVWTDETHCNIERLCYYHWNLVRDRIKRSMKGKRLGWHIFE